jgi:lipid II:glycine glycyltransferase (peptidoglycan interpeptide bridge formation enzyme)
MAAAWRGAARDCGVVSEFVRFHPVLRTHAPFALVDGVEPRSETVIWDLRGDVAAGLSPTCAKNLRWAEKKGVVVEFEDGAAWPRFRTLYRDTMKRRGARDYYDFDDSYFKTLCAGLGSDLRFAFAVHEGRDAAAAMILRSGERAHYHLGASDHALRSLCATNALLVALARRARDEGATVFHLGGGLSSGDSLFEFKAGFSAGRGRFHVGRFIDDIDAYGQLVEERRERGPLDESYFPAYRAPLSGREP